MVVFAALALFAILLGIGNTQQFTALGGVPVSCDTWETAATGGTISDRAAVTIYSETGDKLATTPLERYRTHDGQCVLKFSVDVDAGHKLAILSSIAFGTQVNFDAVEIEGIERVSIDDINRAADMGYRIKLLGVAQMTARGLEQRMSPCLVPCDSPLGQLEGGTNMVVIEGDAVGQIVLRGAGAGEGPTASAVLSDRRRAATGSGCSAASSWAIPGA